MIQLALNDVACSGCIGRIRKKIKRFDGIEKVEILSGHGKIEINYNEKVIRTEELNRAIHKFTFKSFD
ncbi:MAG: heavy-metal-associated domain-containing protein [Neobacillus sp.]|jgi:copper chaperone CopZ